MSMNNPPLAAPTPNLSIAGAFRAAPTPVKVLAASMYLPALLILGLTVLVVMGALGNLLVTGVLVFYGGLLALISFLLGKGIARGAHGTWLLSVVLYVIGLLSGVPLLIDGVNVASILYMVTMIVPLVLLFTPTVRAHCTKK